WIVERREAMEADFVTLASANSSGGGWSSQLDFIFQLAVEAVNVRSRNYVCQIRRKQLAAHGRSTLQRFRFLRQNVFPRLCLRIVEHDFAIGRAVVRLDQELAVYVVDYPITVVANFGHNRGEGFVTLRQLAEEN